MLELTDPALHVALLVLGGVVAGVLLEVAFLAGALDLVGDLDAAAGGEIVELGLQAVEGLLGQLWCCHGDAEASRAGSSPSRTQLVGSPPMTHKIAVIGGDGIGPDVTAEAIKVVRAAGVDIETTEFDLGGQRYLRDGEILADETLEELRSFDCILLGAVGTPEVPPGVIERGLLLKMRFALDLYINQRPFSGTAPGGTEPHDFIVIRENTEGPYVGEGGVLRQGTPHEVATQGSVNTRMGVERCIRYAFELADSRPRKHLTLVHKTNVLTFAGGLWDRTFNEVAAEYPQVDHGLQPRRRGVHLLRHRPAPLRRGGHRQPVRRHPHRPRRCGLGRHRAGVVGQPQSGPHRPVDVRAGARLGTRHRRHQRGESDGGDPQRGADARLPRRGRRRRSDPGRVRRSCHREHHRRW